MFNHKGIIKTDMSYREGILYGAIVVDSVEYNKHIKEIRIKRKVDRFKCYCGEHQTTTFMELFVLVQAILIYGTDYLYLNDNRAAIEHLTHYDDVQVEWVARIYNKDADRHTKGTTGVQKMSKVDYDNVYKYVTNILNGYTYAVESR